MQNKVRVSTHVTSYESILSAWRVVPCHTVAYTNDSYSSNMGVQSETCTYSYVNGSCRRLFDQSHTYTKSSEVVIDKMLSLYTP
jgi:hypothetical protein